MANLIPIRVLPNEQKHRILMYAPIMTDSVALLKHLWQADSHVHCISSEAHPPDLVDQHLDELPDPDGHARPSCKTPWPISLAAAYTHVNLERFEGIARTCLQIALRTSCAYRSAVQGWQKHLLALCAVTC